MQLKCGIILILGLPVKYILWLKRVQATQHEDKSSKYFRQIPRDRIKGIIFYSNMKGNLNLLSITFSILMNTFDLSTVSEGFQVAGVDLPPLDVDASEVIDLWEEGDGLQDNTFVKRKVSKVLIELLSDERMAGRQH